MNHNWVFIWLCVVGLSSQPVSAEGESVATAMPVTIEGEVPVKAIGEVMQRTNARRGHALLLKCGESAEYLAKIDAEASYTLRVQYSNDDEGKCDDVVIMADGVRVGTFHSQNTHKEGTKGGDGWNEFAESPDVKLGILSAGEHAISLLVDDGDAFGIEIDRLTIVQAGDKGSK